jgi:hypothetical protein
MLNLFQLKNNFTDIKHLRESVSNLISSLQDKVNILNEIYRELLEKNIEETVTGLDSFHFQNKLINIELQTHIEKFKIIDNRIYGDYYKLYKMVIKYLNENIKNKNITVQFDNKNYPVYKDLDLIITYDFNYTIEIHNDIIQIIDILNNELISREHKLSTQKIKQRSGLNIDNLVNNVNYNNNSLKNQITLFSEYLEVYNNFHTKYLTRFTLKTKLFYGQINNDIKIEESKSSIDYSIGENEIILEENEEQLIRHYIPDDDNLNKKIQINTKASMKNELDSMISGVSLTPQSSYGEKSQKNSKYREKNYENTDPDTNNISSTKKNSKNNKLCNEKLLTDSEIEYNLNNTCNIL